MQQEAKLSFIKRVSRQSNFKNVCLTAAKKHQFWLCHQMIQSDLIIPELEMSTKQQTCTFGEEEDYLQVAFLEVITNLTNDNMVTHPDWVSKNVYQLRKSTFIILQYDFFKPVFGKIVDIAVMDKTVMLCVVEYYGNFLNEHLNSFEVSHYGVIKAVSLDALHDHRPIYPRHSFVNTDRHLYMSLPFIQ